MNNIPEELKKIADSPELYEKSEAVGKQFDLTIDQIGDLDAEIRDVLSGVSPSAGFVDRIVDRLEIDRSIAEKIVSTINTEIFQTIKSGMQQKSDEISSANAVSSLERAGDFSVEQGYKVANETNLEIGNQSDILNDIENPTPAISVNVPKNLPVEPTMANPAVEVKNSHVEPLVDHLLSGAVLRPIQKSSNAVQAPNPKPEAPKRMTPDPYRETFN